MSRKIDIMGAYLSDYSLVFSGRELARRLSINHQTALTHLNQLVKENILNCSTKGKNKHYTLNLNNPQTEMLLATAEYQKSYASLENKELKVMKTGMLHYAEAILLFGSFASGKQKEDSDMDIIVLQSKKKMLEQAASRYPRKINIEQSTWNRFSQALHQKKPLALEIAKNHLIYGNVSKLVNVLVRWNLR